MGSGTFWFKQWKNPVHNKHPTIYVKPVPLVFKTNGIRLSFYSLSKAFNIFSIRFPCSGASSNSNTTSGVFLRRILLPISERTNPFALFNPLMDASFSSSSPKTETRSEEHTSELQSRFDLVCRLLLEKKNTIELKQNLRTRATV